MKVPGADCVISFLSLKGDSKTILFWLIQYDKNKNSQTWTTSSNYYANPYTITSLYYTVEIDYIIALWIDESPTGTFNLKAYTKKFTFNSSSTPTSFTTADGNSNINTKLIIDTFTSTKTINGYSSSGNPNCANGIFEVILNNEVYSYHWDFVTGNQNVMKKYLVPEGSNAVSYYMNLSVKHTSYTASDEFFIPFQFTTYANGVLLLKDTSCLGFARDLQPTKCFQDCPNYEEYDITNNLCKDCPTLYSNAKNYIYNNKCYSTCNPYSVLTNNVCSGGVPANCALPNHWSTVSGACVNPCETYLIPNDATFYCDNCKDTSKYSYNGACVTGTGCPTSSTLMDATRNGCLSCLTQGKYWDGEVANACVASCPTYLVPNGSTGNCDNCKTLSLGYSYNGSCVAGAACPTNTSLVDTNRNGCITCLAQGKYWDAEVALTCVTTCPTYLIPNGTTGKCDNCKTLSLGYSYNGSCVAGASCPTNTSLVDTNRNGCLTCLAQGKYWDAEVALTCVATCPTYLVANGTTGKCDNCKSLALGYSYNGACVAGAGCPTSSTLMDNSRNGCLSCLAQGKYWDAEVANACVATCPTYLVPNGTTGNCDNCKTLSLGYSFNGSCVAGAGCPSSSTLADSNRNGCSDCLAQSKYYDGEVAYTCVTTCPTYLVPNDSTGNCDNCKTLSIGYSYNGSCLAGAACPTNTSLVDTNRNGCLTCLAQGKYRDAEVALTCVATCPTYLVPNGTTGNCDNCKTLSLGYSSNGSCLAGATCPSNTSLVDTNRNGCSTCLAQGIYWDGEVALTCVATCPSYLIPNGTTGNCDNCKTLSLGYSNNGSCVAGAACPTNTSLVNTNRNGCSTCLAQGIYWDAEVALTCVATCPSYLVPNGTTGQCDNCKTLTLGYSYNGACVAGAGCPTTTSLVDTNRNGCVNCISQGKYFDGEVSNTCVTNCPEYLIPNGTTGNCDNCKSLSNGYSVNGACVSGSNCPDYFYLDNSNRNGCLYCKSIGKYFDGETSLCVSTCPIYLVPNISNGNCDNCKLLNLGFSFNGACIAGSLCPNYSVLDNSSRNGCHTCKSINKYYDDGVCVDTCPILKPTNSDNICTNCSGTSNPYFQNGVCVHKCDIGSIYDSANVCTPCPSNRSYIYQNLCLSGCGYLCTGSNKLCYNAKDASPEQYWFDGLCYDVKPSNSAIFDANYNAYKKCVEVVPKQYNYLLSCVFSCPSETILDSTNTTCISYISSGKYNHILHIILFLLNYIIILFS